jgi:hypothetical protein
MAGRLKMLWSLLDPPTCPFLTAAHRLNGFKDLPLGILEALKWEEWHNWNWGSVNER